MPRSLPAMVIAFFLLVAGTALADQLAWIPATGADAEKFNTALAHLKKGDVVYGYCAPCGDHSATAIPVQSVSVSIPEAGFKEIAINGEGIDLAYIYVKTGDGYRNLGMLSGYAPEQVPAALPGGAMQSKE